MKKELCIDSYEGALIADKYNYDSVEVNQALELGGLTPSLSLIRKVVEVFDNEIICMLRPRAAGFYYSKEEYNQMLDELDLILEEDISGVAFGFLTQNYEIDIEKTKEFVKKIHEKNKIAVFHRAFDNTNDYKKSIKELIELEVDRVLTSGQSSNALEGISVINELSEIAGNDIEILAGAGLNSANIKEFIDRTNIKYVHSTCKGYKEDITTNLNISFKIYDNNRYQITDEEEAKLFSDNIN